MHKGLPDLFVPWKPLVEYCSSNSGSEPNTTIHTKKCLSLTVTQCFSKCGADTPNAHGTRMNFNLNTCRFEGPGEVRQNPQILPFLYH